jgi:hypothetical protein
LALRRGKSVNLTGRVYQKKSWDTVSASGHG